MRLILAALLMLSTPALAEVQPKAVAKDDAHVQTAEVAVGEVVVLHLMVGRTVAIQLPTEQTNNQSYGSDSKFVKAAIPAGSNLIFLKPEMEMAPKPFFISSTLADGKIRLYVLQIDVTKAVGDTPLPYTLKLVDPGADQAVKAAAWRWQQKQKQDKADAQALRDAVAHPVDTNLSYILQGETAADWNLLPTREVGDDGRSTHFHLPGARATLIYTVSPDGKESVADCSPDSETHITTCHQLAAKWRLRDGDAELCVYNKLFDPVGVPTPTNTISPEFRRELRVQK